MNEAYQKIQQRFSKKEVFLVATGPSTAYKRMDFLLGFPTISVNLGFLMFDTWGFNPDMVMFSDKDVLLNNLDLYRERLLLNPDTVKILTGRAAQEAPEDIIDDNTIVIPQVKDEGVVGFETKPSKKGFFRGHTVMYNALQLVYELGVKRVNILGMDLSNDHNWGVNGHSFEIQLPQNIAGIDFGERYKAAIKKGLPSNTEQRKVIEQSFGLARRVFETDDRLIINDESSSLEALPKEDLLNNYVNQTTVTAVVPAKSSSRRVQGKNVKLLGEKPLFLHIIDTLLASHTIDQVVLDTDSKDVANHLGNREVKWLKRPVELATNATDGNKLFYYEANELKGDIIIQVLPTAPFLSRRTIDDLVYQVKKDDAHDSAFAVIKKALYLWGDNSPLNYDIHKIPNSVDLTPTTIEAMSAYAVERNVALRTKLRFGNNPAKFIIPDSEAIDIDTMLDFEIAEAIIKWRNKNGTL